MHASGVTLKAPAALRLKTTELKALKRRQANLVAFVADGEGTKAVGEALAELEPQLKRLERQVASLRRACGKVIRTPSLAWIRERVTRLRSILELRTSKPAALLRRLLCPIRLEPVIPSTGRPYYLARTALDMLVLLDDPESDDDGSDSGAKSLRWWRRRESNPRPRIRPHRNLHAYPRLLFRHPCESAAKTAGG